MSFLGKGVNKLFASLGSLFKKIVELTFNFLGFIKFKISKKSYARDEISRKGKITGRKVKNSMDKFALKAQVATDKGVISLGRLLRLAVLGILKGFNSTSKGLYKLSEKSKDKFTAYCITCDEKNEEKFIQFDNLIGRCDDIENYEETAISDDFDNSYDDLEENISNDINDNFKNNETDISFKEVSYINDKNTQNKINKENTSDLDKTLYDNIDNEVDYDLDKTLYEDSNFYDSLNTSYQASVKNQHNETSKNSVDKNTNSYNESNTYYEDKPYESTSKNGIFNFSKRKDKDSPLDETLHGEHYEFNSSIKLANRNYSKDKINNTYNEHTKSDLDKTKFINLNDSDKTEMIDRTNFRDAINSKLQSQNDNRNKVYKTSLDNDDESIRKFLSDDE